MSSARKEPKKPAVKVARGNDAAVASPSVLGGEEEGAARGFDEELDSGRERKGKVEKWFESHPEILAKVDERLKRAAEDMNSASATEIWRALKKHFKAPFADYTFRQWVYENYEGFEFRTRGASRS